MKHFKVQCDHIRTQDGFQMTASVVMQNIARTGKTHNYTNQLEQRCWASC